MKGMAWYTVIFNLVVIILFILHAIGVVETPPFTTLEDIIWAVFLIPVVIFGILVVRKPR